jgi:DNA-binding NarL/FixJ family response regulator
MQDPTNRPIQLLIVDANPDAAQNVRKLLQDEPDIQVVGVANTAHDAIAMANVLRPDVILIDIDLPDMDGLRATEIILHQVPTRVVIMSLHGEPEYLTRAMVAMARGYLVKPFTAEDLINTVRTTARMSMPFRTEPQPPDQPGQPALAPAAPAEAAAAKDESAPPPAPADGEPPSGEVHSLLREILPAYAAPPAPAASRAKSGEQALQFSAYHPNALAVETWETLLVYSHVLQAADEIAADAATFTELGSAPRVARGQATRTLAHGVELTVEPHMPGVTFSPTTDAFIWRGGWHRSLFRFRAEAALANTEPTGWVDVYAGPRVPIARVELAFPFRAPRPALATRRPEGRIVTTSLHDTVFISYSHRDREAFRQACAEYARFGITALTDEHLEAGADYERDLERMISGARVFHLLWSPTAARSAECRQEWTVALEREPTERFIKPWYWRRPLVAPPSEFVEHHISFRYQRLRRRLLKPETWL